GHRCVTLQSGTGGCTAGHRWVICWAQVGGASGRTAGHRWAELAGGTAGHRSLSQIEESTANVTGEICTNNQGTDYQCRSAVPSNAAQQCPAVSSISAQKCHPSVPSS
ncbi:unnamed protein product, partial [Staurois parvus]